MPRPGRKPLNNMLIVFVVIVYQVHCNNQSPNIEEIQATQQCKKNAFVGNVYQVRCNDQFHAS